MEPAERAAKRDRPWLFRTYAGHSSAAASNALYRANLAKGQTGLSVAFDLPTQTGYDPDHPLAAGEVGRVGVPVSHLGDMRQLFEGITLARMNTSMTINATAPWLLALYAALADETGQPRAELRGTTQNDIVKEYLSRGTYILPPEASLRLTADVAAWAASEMPQWNPCNVCSYHLQEAGATPAQEIAFALATAISILDEIRRRPSTRTESFPAMVGRMSFFVNAGIRFVEEMCKLRAFGELWDGICRDRYGVEDPRLRRFRYGVQVNSLGLTEQQPENNIARILLETLAVTLSKRARARAVQLPAWNEALGLPTRWDQQWSLRLQQILALETDLLEYGDLFDGSPVVAARVAALREAAESELREVEAEGGAINAIEYMKSRLVASNAERIARIESGEQVVIGVNAYSETEESPLAGGATGICSVDPNAERQAYESLAAWRGMRNASEVDAALARLEGDARTGANIMPASVAAAKAGVTTGEWAAVLRTVFGAYRAPTGISQVPAHRSPETEAIRAEVEALGERLGGPVTFLVGKPGLDGHSNGAEQVAVRARDCGMRVVYEGIRFAPGEIVARAREEGAHLVGISILSGTHLALAQAVVDGLRKEGLGHVPVVAGGIIPPEDAAELTRMGVARIYTPKNFEINRIMSDLVGLIDGASLRQDARAPADTA